MVTMRCACYGRHGRKCCPSGSEGLPDCIPCSGRRRFTDGVLAHVQTPGGPTSPAQPLFRLTRSPPTPCLCPSLTPSNLRGTDPYARWWGRGGTARCPPIPINLHSIQC